ncbi:MAG: hypothetical protein KC643_33470, partial [Nitrospira sp.]|nr:hypothetical protein [Nitrospira sp.]
MSKPDDPYKERDDKIREALHASGLAHIRTLLTHPNAKEASKLVEDHAANDFDKEYAGELEALTLDCAKEDEQTDAVRDALHDLEQQKKATKSHLTVSELKGTGQTTGLPFSAWGLNDQVKFVCTILLMMLVLLAGSGNVFSAIMAKAEP